MANKKNRIWLIIQLGFVAILVAVGLVYYHAVNITPVVYIPKPKMPSPNALDYYMKAGRLIKDSAVFAPTLYGPATGTVSLALYPTFKVYTLKDKAALVANNAEALAKLRQGFAYEFMNPRHSSHSDYQPQLIAFRKLGFILQMESQVKAARGDWSGSMDSCLDAIKLGEDAPRGGPIITMKIGTAVEVPARQDAWKAIDHLDAAQSKAAVKRIEDITSYHVAFSEIIQEVKWAAQASLIESMKKPNWREEIGMIPGSPSANAKNAIGFLISLRYSKRTLLTNYADYMDQYAINSKHPYISKSSAHPPLPNDPLCQVLLPDFGWARLNYTNCSETQNGLFAVSLALRAYNLDHGIYPIKLSDLAPTYLRKVPEDPFALKGPLKYRLTGKNYILYSNGPDGKDDGGKAIYDAGLPTNNRYSVQENSKGDIVAGVNQR